MGGNEGCDSGFSGRVLKSRLPLIEPAARRR
jgi:hypothetical protein